MVVMVRTVGSLQELGKEKGSRMNVSSSLCRLGWLVALGSGPEVVNQQSVLEKRARVPNIAAELQTRSGVHGGETSGVRQSRFAKLKANIVKDMRLLSQRRRALATEWRRLDAMRSEHVCVVVHGGTATSPIDLGVDCAERKEFDFSCGHLKACRCSGSASH